MGLLFEDFLMKFMSVDYTYVCQALKKRETPKSRSQVPGAVRKRRGFFRTLEWQAVLCEVSSSLQLVKVLCKQYSLIRSAIKSKPQWFSVSLSSRLHPPPASLQEILSRNLMSEADRQSSFERGVGIQPLSSWLGSSVDK